MGSPHTIDQLDTRFADTHAIANAGLLLPATLAERLGIEQTADHLIDLGERPGAAHPGRKLLTLVHSMLAGSRRPVRGEVADHGVGDAGESVELVPGEQVDEVVPHGGDMAGGGRLDGAEPGVGEHHGGPAAVGGHVLPGDQAALLHPGQVVG
jgi:hypothetical protein